VADAELPTSEWSIGMTVWTKDGTTNANREAPAVGRHGKLRDIEIMLRQGGSAAEACRRIAVTAQTYHSSPKEYGGLKTDQARRMDGGR